MASQHQWIHVVSLRGWRCSLHTSHSLRDHTPGSYNLHFSASTHLFPPVRNSLMSLHLSFSLSFCPSLSLSHADSHSAFWPAVLLPQRSCESDTERQLFLSLCLSPFLSPHILNIYRVSETSCFIPRPPVSLTKNLNSLLWVRCATTMGLLWSLTIIMVRKFSTCCILWKLNLWYSHHLIILRFI